jgi:hypothetical protein
VEALSKGNGHHGTGIPGGIDPELEGGIGFHLHEKGGELCFGHAALFACYEQTLGLIFSPGAKTWFAFSIVAGGTQHSQPAISDLSERIGVSGDAAKPSIRSAEECPGR